jgi:hypothetical protein
MRSLSQSSGCRKARSPSKSSGSGCRKARSPSKSSGSGCRKARSPSKSSGSGSHSAPLTEFGLPKGIVFTRGQNLLLQSKSFHTEPFTGSGKNKNIVFAPNGSFCYAFRFLTSGKNKSLKSIRSPSQARVKTEGQKLPYGARHRLGSRAQTLQKPCFWTGVGLEPYKNLVFGRASG